MSKVTMWRRRGRCVIKPAYSVSFLLSINIFVWQNVLYFLDAPRIYAYSGLALHLLPCSYTAFSFFTTYQNVKTGGAGKSKSVHRLGRLPRKREKDKSYFSSQKYREGILDPRSSESNSKRDSIQGIQRSALGPLTALQCSGKGIH